MSRCSRGQSQPAGEIGLVALVEGPADDQLHGAADQLGSLPRNRPAEAVRAAAQARAKACSLRGRGEFERPDVSARGLATQPGRQ